MLVLSASTYLSVAKTSPKYMFHHLAIFTICSGLWIFIDYNYISLIIKNNIFIMSMKQICLYIACIFFIKYIKAITENSSKLLTIFLDLSEALHILCCLLFIILQLLGIKDSYELLKPYLILSSINLFICTVIIIQQAFQTGKNTICILAFSLIDFAFFEILQTIIYLIKNSNKNNSHFANIGFVSFISIQIVVISISAKETILQAQKATKLEEALTQSNIKILLSQIQPHFLFNSLAAIKQLCNTVPEKAALAIDNFSTFLRGNIDALSSNAPLPFSKELNIVKCYLNLEKIRFEERLNIQYDIQETDFFIPALTVQPLVENAVRYGITKKIDGGTIYIATSRTKNNYIVTITDDGLGFDINQKRNDGRSHVGIKNVRSRIKALCNGNLEIYSSPGIGTVVSIIIPDTKKNMKK